MATRLPWITLARIVRPQGRKGEVLADLLTSNPAQFTERPHVWLAPAGFTAGSEDAAPEPTPAEVRASWLPVGRNAGRIVLHLAGVESITQAEALAGREVVIPASERAALEPGTVYISDLVGAVVFDHDEQIGTVEDVQFPMSPDGSRRLDEAAPLLVVRSPAAGELLIPFVNAYIREMDLSGGLLRMMLPPGLLDLNQAEDTALKATEHGPA